MNDQERTTDLLLSEKKMSSNYDTYASECVNMQLRDEFLQILKQSHCVQSDLFQAAQSKGWYQVEQAQDNKISQAYQKFTSSAPNA